MLAFWWELFFFLTSKVFWLTLFSPNHELTVVSAMADVLSKTKLAVPEESC